LLAEVQPSLGIVRRLAPAFGGERSHIVDPPGRCSAPFARLAALEPALARPQQKWAYDEGADLGLLAAAYGFGLARNHPYRDGNKRVAFLAMATFLGLNGFDMEAPEAEVVTLMVGVAAGHVTERQLADWLRRHLVPLRD
jgi:death-on-curing protein